MGPGFTSYAWMVALLPLIASAVTLFVGKRWPGKSWIYGVAGVGTSFALSLGALWHFVQGGEAYESSVTWFTVGPLHLELGQYVDGLTAVMLIVVTAVSLAVHVYSIGYMSGDVRFTWFYVVLSLFTSAMLNVVIANDLFQLLVGWEVMGLCSYLLIGHWWEEKINSDAAVKAFITTRIGDSAFLIGIIFIWVHFGTLDFDSVFGRAEGLANGTATVIALLLFAGAVGKSAQLPLHVWLPDAMEGPTPVSALIHAATMVTAGVYLVVRAHPIFEASSVALNVVAVTGIATAIYAGLSALGQDDIK
ncbi:MAG: NADH-quinone oxidoreductase subunit 5 family protein, partial [Actinomycetota bacterium]